MTWQFPATSNYLHEGYINVPCPASLNCPFASLTQFTVGAGATPNINFTLSPGGGISGTVTDAVTAAPLSNVTIQIYNSSGSFVAAVLPNGLGRLYGLGSYARHLFRADVCVVGAQLY